MNDQKYFGATWSSWLQIPEMALSTAQAKGLPITPLNEPVSTHSWFLSFLMSKLLRYSLHTVKFTPLKVYSYRNVNEHDTVKKLPSQSQQRWVLLTPKVPSYLFMVNFSSYSQPKATIHLLSVPLFCLSQNVA